MNWGKNIQNITDLLFKTQLLINGSIVDFDEGIDILIRETKVIRENNKTIHCIGNGASASMASHFAADISKNAKINTQVFTDISLITAISNDISFEQVYAEPLRRSAVNGDMLLAISSSGMSANILNAAKYAKEKKLKVITLSGMKITNPLKELGDFSFYTPADAYGDIESVHATILHYWIDCVILNK